MVELIDLEKKFEDFLNNIDNNISIDKKDEKVYISVSNNIEEENLLSFLKELFVFEKEFAKLERNNVLLNLRELDVEKLAISFKLAMETDDLSDSLMILNLINLVKTYNSLDDSFFENEDIYIKDIEDLVDLKIEIKPELQQFINKISIYFLSMLKSYNKYSFTVLDEYDSLPNLYLFIFNSCDFLTLCGIFANAEPFSTDKCIYLNNSLECMVNLQLKGNMAISFMGDFLKGSNNDNSNE